MVAILNVENMVKIYEIDPISMTAAIKVTPPPSCSCMCI